MSTPVVQNEDEYNWSNFEFNCGTSVVAACEGKSVGRNGGFTDASFQKFVGGAVNVFTSGVNIFLSTTTSSFTPGMLRGINALRCAVVNLGDNAWNFIAAAWWTAFQFGFQTYVE